MRTKLLFGMLLSMVGTIDSVWAGDLKTGFEFTDTSGQFRVGAPPYVAVFKGGEARDPGNPDLVRKPGKSSWTVAPGETGVITFGDPPGGVQFYFRDESANVQSELRVFTPDGTLIQSVSGKTKWKNVFTGGALGVGRIELSNNATGTGRVAIDNLWARYQGVAAYCTTKVNSCGTSPAVGFSGGPSTSMQLPFMIGADKANPNVPGLLLYTAAGPANVPFQGGTLCVAAPFHRSVPVMSDSSGMCESRFLIDWSAFARGRLGGDPQPFLLELGQEIHLQWFGRDTPAHGPYMTYGLVYLLCPGGTFGR